MEWKPRNPSICRAVSWRGFAASHQFSGEVTHISDVAFINTKPTSTIINIHKNCHKRANQPQKAQNSANYPPFTTRNNTQPTIIRRRLIVSQLSLVGDLQSVNYHWSATYSQSTIISRRLIVSQLSFVGDLQSANYHWSATYSRSTIIRRRLIVSQLSLVGDE